MNVLFGENDNILNKFFRFKHFKTKLVGTEKTIYFIKLVKHYKKLINFVKNSITNNFKYANKIKVSLNQCLLFYFDIFLLLWKLS